MLLGKIYPSLTHYPPQVGQNNAKQDTKTTQNNTAIQGKMIQQNKAKDTTL